LPPLCSTLFPYTTLFRSLFAERIETTLGAMLAIADDEGLRLLEFVDRRATERELSILRNRLQTNVVPGEHRHLDAMRSQLADYLDRKSTRLNSSHVKISY